MIRSMPLSGSARWVTNPAGPARGVPAGALRLLILSRPWAEPWEFDERELEEATHELENLWRFGAERGDRDVAEHEVALALLDDLDIRRALEVAKQAGGQVLRDLVALLGLT